MKTADLALKVVERGLGGAAAPALAVKLGELVVPVRGGGVDGPHVLDCGVVLVDGDGSFVRSFEPVDEARTPLAGVA